MKNLKIELELSFINKDGRAVKTKALIGGDWHQWGGVLDDLNEAMAVVEVLNRALNKNFMEEVDETTFDETED